MKDLRNILLSLLTVSLLTACTQEELADGTQFAEGQYPLVINTACIGSPVTRATPDGTWRGDETIYVQVINDYDSIKAKNETIEWDTIPKLIYSVAIDGTMTLADSLKAPLWERSNEEKLIRAWYCRNYEKYPFPVLEELPTKWKVHTNQYDYPNDNYPYYWRSDFLFAQQEFSFGDEVSLTFYHQVAKVVVNINGQPLQAQNLKIPFAYLRYATYYSSPYAYTPPASPSGVYGEWTKPSGNPDDDIAMKPATANTNVNFGDETGPQDADFTFEALVIPQTTSSTNKFTIRASVESDDGYDGSWRYEFASPVTWEAGHVYTYNLTLTPSGLKLDTSNISPSWVTDADGASGSGEVVL